MSDNPIPTPAEPGPMDDDTAVEFLMTPPETEPNPEDKTEPAPDAGEAEEAAPGENPDEPEGDPTDEAGEVVEESDPGEEEFVVVTVSGEKREVPLEEAIAGYSRTEDYKQKTRDLADERRGFQEEVEAARAEIAQMRARYAAHLNENEQEPDWEKLREEDPIGYVEQYTDWSRKQASRNAERARIAQEDEATKARFRSETGLKAVEVFPEWRNQGEFVKGAEARAEAAMALGFTPQELEANADYRAVALLEKAARYDALMAGKASSKAKVLKKVREAPAKIKPEARKTRSTDADAEKARLEKLRRTGNDDDAIAYLLGG